MAINELRSISIFVRAAELGSLRKAAAAMGITPQAASQALAQLERRLDVRLFHRTTRVMSLTDEGRQFLEEARPALLGLQRAWRALTWPRGNRRPAAHCRAAVDVSQGAMAAVGRVLCSIPGHRAGRAIGGPRRQLGRGPGRRGLPPRRCSARRRDRKALVPGAAYHLRLPGISTSVRRAGNSGCTAVTPLQRVSKSGYRRNRALAREGRRRCDRTAGRARDLHERRISGTGGSARGHGHRATGRRDGRPIHSFGSTCAAAGRPHAGPRELLCVLRQPHVADSPSAGVHRPRGEATGRQPGVRPDG